MKDRLGELENSLNPHRSLAEERSNSSFGAASFSQLEAEVAHSGFMGAFFEEIGEARASVALIEVNVKEVATLQDAVVANPVSDDAVQRQLDELASQIKRQANKVRVQLKAMGNVIEMDRDAEERDKCRQASANLRIRELQHSAVSRHFIDTMTEYNRAQGRFRERCKDRIQRQMEIAGKFVDEEELETLLEGGDLACLTQGITSETQDARRTLADIEARHRDLVRLEASIKELHSMFADMAVLVDSQGAMVDSIEYNVERTKGYVEEGTRGVRNAVAYKKKARKKKVVCLIVGCSAAAFLLIFLVSWLKS